MPYKYDPPDRFEAKDKLLTGNQDKKIVGKEIDDEFKKLEQHLTKRVVASLKWNVPDPNTGQEIRYGQNIASVHNMEGTFPDGQDMSAGWGHCRVYFENLIPEFDLHYAILIQPYASSSVNSHVIATVNWQDAGFVQWAWGYLTDQGEKFVKPPGPPAFSMLVVDAYQGEVTYGL